MFQMPERSRSEELRGWETAVPARRLDKTHHGHRQPDVVRSKAGILNWIKTVQLYRTMLVRSFEN